jgi:hypothetical protein
MAFSTGTPRRSSRPPDHVADQPARSERREQEAEQMSSVSMPAGDRRGQLLNRRDQDREQHCTHDQTSQERVEPDRRQGGPNPRARTGRSSRRRRQRHHHEDDGEVADRVDRKAGPWPDRRHEPAPDGRPDQPRGVVGDRTEPRGPLGELGRDGRHDDLLECRAREHAGHADQKRRRVHLRHPRDVLPGHHREPRGGQGLADVEECDELAPLIAVGQLSTERG